MFIRVDYMHMKIIPVVRYDCIVLLMYISKLH